jgi:hypothetical protein
MLARVLCQCRPRRIADACADVRDMPKLAPASQWGRCKSLVHTETKKRQAVVAPSEAVEFHHPRAGREP